MKHFRKPEMHWTEGGPDYRIPPIRRIGASGGIFMMYE